MHMGQGVKIQTSCSSCSLEEVLQKATDTIKLKAFMEGYSKCAVRTITDSSFLSPFSRLLSKETLSKGAGVQGSKLHTPTAAPKALVALCESS